MLDELFSADYNQLHHLGQKPFSAFPEVFAILYIIQFQIASPNFKLVKKKARAECSRLGINNAYNYKRC